MGFGPALQGEVAEQHASGAEPVHPAGQRPGPALPLSAVEFFHRLQGFALELGFAPGEKLEQRYRSRIIRTRQAPYPVLHHVQVTELAQTAEQALACSLHFLPGRVGIKGGASGSHGTAAAQSHTQIMDWVGCEIQPDTVALFQYLPRPEGETGMGLRGAGGHSSRDQSMRAGRYVRCVGHSYAVQLRKRESPTSSRFTEAGGSDRPYALPAGFRRPDHGTGLPP